jgi:hypothetical protein
LAPHKEYLICVLLNVAEKIQHSAWSSHHKLIHHVKRCGKWEKLSILTEGHVNVCWKFAIWPSFHHTPEFAEMGEFEVCGIRTYKSAIKGYQFTSFSVQKTMPVNGYSEKEMQHIVFQTQTEKLCSVHERKKNQATKPQIHSMNQLCTQKKNVDAPHKYFEAFEKTVVTEL